MVERTRRGLLVCAALATLIVPAARAAADSVTSKGTVLHGKITALSSSGLVLETEYGKGPVAIAWTDIEDVTTDAAFQILYVDGQETDDSLQGIAGDKLLVGATRETATAVVWRRSTAGSASVQTG